MSASRRVTVALTEPLNPEAMQALAAHDVRVFGAAPGQDYRAVMRDAEILIARTGGPLPADIFEDAPRLIGVIRYGAGLDVIPMAAADRHAIPVCYVPGGNARAVAEFATIAMGALSRRTAAIDRDLRVAGWAAARARSVGVHTLEGTTVGIVGLGQVGRRIARICHLGYDQRVVAHSLDAVDLGFPVEYLDLDALFVRADFVFLCCPLTDATRHLVSAARLAAMKPTAFLINVARGGLVDTDALVAALKAGDLAGAALDVFDPEPLPAGHPLTARSDVLLSAHVAGGSVESNIAIGESALAQMAQILAGECPDHIVNPAAWTASQERRQVVLGVA